jgi:hypothetical protein
MSNEAEVWETFEADLDAMDRFLSGTSLMGQDQIDRYHASRAIDGLESAINGLAMGEMLYPHSEDSDYTISITGAFETLGLDVPEEHKRTIPDFMRCDIRQTILTHIAERKLSAEFIEAWSSYKQAFGVLLALTLNNESGKAYFKKYIVDGTRPHIIQTHVYAYWMEKHWLQGGMNKEQAHIELAKSLQNFINQNSRNQKRISLLQALRTMIVEDSVGHVELRGKIKNFSKLDVVRITGKAIISPLDLPELNLVNTL